MPTRRGQSTLQRNQMTSDIGVTHFASLAMAEPSTPMRRPTGEPNVMSPNLKESKPFCSPRDQIQWGILFLSRHLRGSSPWEREECLQDVWDRAREQGNLLCLQIIRDYRECLKESGPTYRRHQDWFLSNWNDPEFWAKWENELEFARPL